MVLSKPYQEKFDAGVLSKEVQVIENMLNKGCDWDFITEITDVTKSQYEKLKKAKAQKSSLLA
jgi:hypothetical protein